MKRIFQTVLMLTVLMLVGTSFAYAQATRTWVSGVGDDVNPCSRTAPCKTFAGAISKTAAGGVISVLDPGGYGSVTITKSMTLDGGGIEGSILAGGTAGIVINAAATDKVTIRNLSIYGTTNATGGIRIINSSSNVTVQNCIITGFTNGIIMEQSVSATAQVYVYDSFIHDNSNYGLLMTNGRAVVDNVRFERNAYGVGVLGAGTTASVARSVAAGHQLGMYADVGNLSISDSTISANVYGLGASTAGVVTVAGTSLSGNRAFALFNEGGQLLTFGNNALSGNANDGTFSGTVTLK